MKKIYFLMIVALLCAVQVNAREFIDLDLDSIVTLYSSRSDKYVYLRDGDIVYEYYFWRTQTNDWERGSKTVYEYKGDRQTKVISYPWNEEQNTYMESPWGKDEYRYDERGKKLYEAHYDWDFNLNDWKSESSSSTEYQYDDAGKVAVTYSPDAANPSKKTEYQYDVQGYLIKEISYSKVNLFNDWAKSAERIYHNDTQGKCTSFELYEGHILQYVNGLITIDVTYWGLYGLQTYEYDALGRVKRYVFEQIIYEAKSATEVVDTRRRDTVSSTYYYRNNVSIGELENNDVAVYPNPIVESFRINGITVPTEVIIADLSGRTILQQTIEANESVTVGNLPKGLYLVCVNGKTLKVVKR
jgi:hypothetical protein